MQLGMVGLGEDGREPGAPVAGGRSRVVVYDVNPETVSTLEGEGAAGAASLEEFVSKLSKPRAAWVMVPAALTGETVEKLAALMEPGDIMIDGGNSYYRDDIERAQSLEPLGIHYVDVGTSGGVFGLARGFCLMIGGEQETVAHLAPIFETIAPGVDTEPRTEGATGPPFDRRAGISPQPHHSELHQAPSSIASFNAASPSPTLPRMCTRSARRPRSCRTWKSPRACAAFTTPNVYFWPGTSRSAGSSHAICRNTPEFGPPL